MGSSVDIELPFTSRTRYDSNLDLAFAVDTIAFLIPFIKIPVGE